MTANDERQAGAVGSDRSHEGENPIIRCSAPRRETSRYTEPVGERSSEAYPEGMVGLSLKGNSDGHEDRRVQGRADGENRRRNPRGVGRLYGERRPYSSGSPSHSLWE